MKAKQLSSTACELFYTRNEPIKLLLISDVHIDNPKCNRDLLFEHLNRAKKLGAKVLVNGDLFCLMQGKYDPRRSKKDVRPEHNVSNYLDAVIEDTVNLLSPYADIIAFVGEGNHESAILKNVETDILTRFVERFNERNKVNVIRGGYKGWIIIRKTNTLEQTRGASMTYKIYHHHGYGGGAPQTYGTIQHSHTRKYIGNADCIWMGHTHSCYIVPTESEIFDTNPSAYRPKLQTVYNVRTSAYKEEFADCAGGWHIERGGEPKSLGGIFCEITTLRPEKRYKFYAEYTPWIKQ